MSVLTPQQEIDAFVAQATAILGQATELCDRHGLEAYFGLCGVTYYPETLSFEEALEAIAANETLTPGLRAKVLKTLRSAREGDDCDYKRNFAGWMSSTDECYA